MRGAAGGGSRQRLALLPERGRRDEGAAAVRSARRRCGGCVGGVTRVRRWRGGARHCWGRAAPWSKPCVRRRLAVSTAAGGGTVRGAAGGGARQHTRRSRFSAVPCSGVAGDRGSMPCSGVGGGVTPCLSRLDAGDSKSAMAVFVGS
uniref:Uncharacterized protein n=2 Tax=Oryza sativa subsp. japonica TaxID=39947 RepID=Q75IV6_ORYSJ|nr:hypothetical protein [Oryza sativa Japonica Group]